MFSAITSQWLKFNSQFQILIVNERSKNIKKTNLNVLSFACVKPKTAEEFERDGLAKESSYLETFISWDMIKAHAFRGLDISEDDFKCKILKSLTGPMYPKSRYFP